jgi:hypothetical protein
MPIPSEEVIGIFFILSSINTKDFLQKPATASGVFHSSDESSAP